MTEKEKMLNGFEYDGSDAELREIFHEAKDMLKEYNATNSRDSKIRENLLKKLLGKAGKNVYIEPPFYCDYGENIYLGNNVYLNANCVILDSAKVTIGNNVLLATNVQILAAGHPLQADERVVNNKIVDITRPITIGNDVWIGGGSIICPGVTIGNNVVIGAGSVVVKDIPSGSVAVGNPCKVIKKL